MFNKYAAATPVQRGLIGHLTPYLVCTVFLVWLFLAWADSPLIIFADSAFFNFFGTVTRESWATDMIIVQIFRTNTAKIVPMLACIVWLLFERRRLGESNQFFGQVLLGSLLAMTVSRLMQNLSSYRPRPLHNPDIDYRLPFGVAETELGGWSSFPSDTAGLAFAIAAGVFVASRRLGIAAFVWAVVVVAFPRAYAGLHYPSDLVGGALIGIICTMGAAPLILNAISSRTTLVIDDKWMPLSWTLAFLYMFQMASMFDDVRRYGSFAMDVLQPDSQTP